jgi:hypothetical protein
MYVYIYICTYFHIAHYIILAFPHHIPIMIGFMPVVYIRAGYCGIAEEGGDKDSGVRGAS